MLIYIKNKKMIKKTICAVVALATFWMYSCEKKQKTDMLTYNDYSIKESVSEVYVNKFFSEQVNSDILKIIQNEIKITRYFSFDMYTKSHHVDSLDLNSNYYCENAAFSTKEIEGVYRDLTIKLQNIKSPTRIKGRSYSPEFTTSFAKYLVGNINGMPINLIAKEIGYDLNESENYRISSTTRFYGEIGDELEINLRLNASVAVRLNDCGFDLPLNYHVDIGKK